jgi:phospholipase/carboxylesterase
LATLAVTALPACRSSQQGRRVTASAAPVTSVPAVGQRIGEALSVVELGTVARDNDALVLLHGWGAPGDDLVALGRELVRENTMIFVPAAPLVEGNGRAWWHLDAAARARYAKDEALPPDLQPLAAIASARRAVQTLLQSIHERLSPSLLTVAGFSQGAMLALDLALQCEPRVDRVAVLSGALLLDSLPAVHNGCGRGRRVLVTHGRVDPIVPFENAERAVAILEQRGIKVDFRPFDGRHEIPRSVRTALGEFAFGA